MKEKAKWIQNIERKWLIDKNIWLFALCWNQEESMKREMFVSELEYKVNTIA